MTEPVAYMWKTVRGTIVGLTLADDKNPHVGNATPLYTAEQLHPRVKMTQAEFDEFNSLNENFSILEVLLYVRERRYTKTVNLFLFRELELAQLWSDYDRNHPEETIEIVPDMKWFVRSKEVQSEGNYYYLINPGQLFPLFTTNFERAGSFSTKEKAELWTNPLTEAVQLPVEGE